MAAARVCGGYGAGQLKLISLVPKVEGYASCGHVSGYIRYCLAPFHSVRRAQGAKDSSETESQSPVIISLIKRGTMLLAPSAILEYSTR